MDLASRDVIAGGCCVHLPAVPGCTDAYAAHPDGERKHLKRCDGGSICNA